jgi:CDP-diacylglycerol pyrophosphatase
LKRSRVLFSKRFIVPLIDSELHLAFEGQSGGTENHPHIHFSGPEILKLKGDPSLKNKIKSLLYAECFSLSPIKPSFELGRSVTAMLNKKFL